jgi:hypothetical protein
LLGAGRTTAKKILTDKIQKAAAVAPHMVRAFNFSCLRGWIILIDSVDKNRFPEALYMKRGLGL